MNRNDVENVLRHLVIKFNKSKCLDEKLNIAKKHIAVQSMNIHLLQDYISGDIPDTEVWTNCKGWEGIYQVSNWGRVRGVERFFIKTTKGRTMAVYMLEHIRETKKQGEFPYPRVSFWRCGKASHFSVHRLVAINFLPNPFGYKQVLHIDNNPENPHFKNLKWGTQKENILHAIESGRWHFGSKNGNSKLKEKDIPKIRLLIKKGLPLNEIGERFGVKKYAIQCVKDGITWKHVQ